MEKKLLSIIIAILALLFVSPAVVLGKVPAVEHSNDSQLIELHAAIFESNDEMAKRFMIDNEQKIKSFEHRLQIKVNGEFKAEENVFKQNVVYGPRGSPG